MAKTKQGYIEIAPDPKTGAEGYVLLPNTVSSAVKDQQKSGQPLTQSLANIDKNMGLMGYPQFSTTERYEVGAVVRYEDRLYRFRREHTQGAFNLEEVELVSIVQLIQEYVDTLSNEQRAEIAKKLESYVKINSYCQPLRVGSADTADNLRSNIGVVEMFYRALVNGGKAIADGQASYKSIWGNSNVMNQLIENGNFQSQANWVKGGGAQAIEISDNECKVICKDSEWNRAVQFPINTFVLYDDHTYYVSFEAKSDDFESCFLLAYTKTLDFTQNELGLKNNWSKFKKIRKPTGRSSKQSYFGITANGKNKVTGTYDGVFYVKNIQLIDLTQMYGLGNEPQSVESFEAIFPEPYYNANKGLIINCNADGLKVVGSNLYCIEQLKGEGYFDGISTSQMFRLFGGGIKGLRFTQGVRYTIVAKGRAIPNNVDRPVDAKWYAIDEDSKSIIRIPLDGERHICTIPFDISTFKMSYNYSGTIYIEEFQISVAIKDMNNPIIPYKEEFISFNIQGIIGPDGQPLFPDGLKSIGDVHDEVTPSYAIKRLESVDIDLGVRYTEYSSTDLIYQVVSSQIDSKALANGAILSDRLIFSRKKIPYSINLASGGSRTSFRFPKDEINSIEQAKDFLVGAKLLYELERPIRVDFAEPLNTTFPVENGGSLEIIPEQGPTPTSAPIVMEVNYPMDAAKSIQELNTTTISPQSQNNLLAVLGQQLNGKITQTYNENTGAYEYKFTANAPAVINESNQ